MKEEEVPVGFAGIGQGGNEKLCGPHEKNRKTDDGDAAGEERAASRRAIRSGQEYRDIPNKDVRRPKAKQFRAQGAPGGKTMGHGVGRETVLGREIADPGPNINRVAQGVVDHGERALRLTEIETY